jgi:hypothetical protein
VIRLVLLLALACLAPLLGGEIDPQAALANLGPALAKMASADGNASAAEFATFQRLFHVDPAEAGNARRFYDLAKGSMAGFQAYAIQAGRELRVIVEAEKVSDQDSDRLSFEIAQKIQTEMTFPGQIKVTVIREKRAVNVAR